jgi:hypothetical protein
MIACTLGSEAHVQAARLRHAEIDKKAAEEAQELAGAHEC